MTEAPPGVETALQASVTAIGRILQRKVCWFVSACMYTLGVRMHTHRHTNRERERIIPVYG